jgi:hypothetical protein
VNQINIDWAGIILERVSKQTLGAYFQDHIFSPLGISAEGLSMFPSQESQKHLAHMHQRNAEGNLTEREHLYSGPLSCPTDKQDSFLQSGGAGLWAKPKEYTKILAAILNEGTSPSSGKQILRPDTVSLMWENQIPNQYVFPPPSTLQNSNNTNTKKLSQTRLCPRKHATCKPRPLHSGPGNLPPAGKPATGLGLRRLSNHRAGNHRPRREYAVVDGLVQLFLVD